MLVAAVSVVDNFSCQ